MEKENAVCAWCPEPLKASRSHRARFCSTRCRMASHRAAKRNPLPVELTTRDRWVRRSSTKVPLTIGAMPASSTDPRTWSSYTEAVKSTAGVGLGFVLSGVDDVVCIDLDHARNPLTGRTEPWAVAILRDAEGTYVELSPSLTGFHIWGRADVRQGRRIRRPDGTAVEVYGTGRYIAMTGRRHGSCPSILADLSAVVSKLTA
ncbi:bifunctional DNA primase/polymerase [Streptomyces sp. ITFR-6]|uniref:bifunctional DNA primase/polymerase n=1 Tax=Streptomyces sp. ITFR-6 TaxID=3075197 RepID=UPI002889E90F|nr:bifunctional DNA primase/polymerase [Streptomyces sp. ITFR-6]WNI28675.1 bifunctional DNA primase/polymerase [Streptomyces sp. ITFR-6]